MPDVHDLGRPMAIAEVTRETGLTRSTIYRKMAAGTFPLCFKIDGTMVRWWEGDIGTWKAALPRPNQISDREAEKDASDAGGCAACTR